MCVLSSGKWKTLIIPVIKVIIRGKKRKLWPKNVSAGKHHSSVCCNLLKELSSIRTALAHSCMTHLQNQSNAKCELVYWMDNAYIHHVHPLAYKVAHEAKISVDLSDLQNSHNASFTLHYTWKIWCASNYIHIHSLS